MNQLLSRFTVAKVVRTRPAIIVISLLVGILMAAVVTQTAKARSQWMGTVTVPLQRVNVDADPEEEGVRADLTFNENGAVTGDIVVWQREPLRREIFRFEGSADGAIPTDEIIYTVVFTEPPFYDSPVAVIGNIANNCPCDTRGESAEDVPIEFYFDGVDVNDPKNTPRYRFIAWANMEYFSQ